MTAILPVALNDTSLAIATHGLGKQYRRQVALTDLCLQVPIGSVTLLVGPNGAGKSTVIKILADLVRATEGDAFVLGMNTRTHSTTIRANLGYVPEQLDWGYGWMKVGRLLEHHAAYFPSWDARYAKQLADAFDLRLDQKMCTLSKGQGRRVHVVMALAHRPPLLILDEPTDGLDPVMRDGMLQALIAHVADTQTSVLISTHHANELEQIADHLSVLRNGSLCAQLPLDDLRRGLLRYRAEIPEGWQGAPEINGSALRKVNARNEIDWTIWGLEAEVARHLTNSGAVVRNVSRLTLNDAALALLDPGMSIR